MVMIIREPFKDDARGLAEVHVRSWQAAYKGQVPDDFLDSLSVDRREKDWRQLLGSPSNKVLVAEAEQRIIAFSSFGPVRDEGLDKNSVGEVYAIYALEEFWDCGIGRRLMEDSLAVLREMDCSTVKVWVLDTNQRAISFYQKFGFTAEDIQKVEARGGVELREIRYSLSMV
ncbi:MAG: GNAT family N-acetyltransferase [Candidatus Latescibacteria bacterium]|nr:GNAT family N-acetyltransferase [Candidatus Latescibacterota bacterium]